MTTLADLTLDVYDMLHGVAQVQRPVEDTLSTATADAADVEWRMSTPALWRRGDYAEHWKGTGTAGEVVLMTEDHPAAADVTVRRSQLRSTADTGVLAIGQVFLKNPPVPAVMIQRAINETVDNDLYANPFRVWYHAQRTLSPVAGKHYYELNAYDFDVDDMWQLDLADTAVGAATFDETGGGTDDLWTSAGHGLAVGDHVRFTAVGTGAAGYAVDTDYWVYSVPSVNTFTLSATRGGLKVEGTGDSAGTWTLVKQLPSLHEFDVQWWRPIVPAATNMSSTGGALYLRQWFDDDHTVYYTARARPDSAAIASLPADIIDMVPWGAMARLVGSIAYRDRQDPRRRSERDKADQPFIDAGFFQNRFLEMKRAYRNRLLLEKPPQRRAQVGHRIGG
uniref:Putative tail protein n=1 Tax=viral metagenome TaxID=1070528 RepID=A0A6H1ZUV0_9ZZZZ